MVSRIYGLICRICKDPDATKNDVLDYIDTAVSHLETLEKAVDLTAKECAFARDEIIRIYNEVALYLGDNVSYSGLEKIYQALSAGRLYYWAKVFDEEETESIKRLIQERQKRIYKGTTWFHSPEVILQRIELYSRYDSQLGDEEVGQIRTLLRADIDELKRVKDDIVFNPRTGKRFMHLHDLFNSHRST